MAEPVYQYINGVPVLMTQSEIDDFNSTNPSEAGQPVTETAVVLPTIIGMAELKVVDFELTGIETSIGLGGAFFVDVGLIWIFLTDGQPDTAYIPFAQCPGFNVDVTARELGHFEVTVTDRATNQPAMPGSVSISVQRVK